MHMYAMKVGIIGATGYTGVELVRLIHQHPHLELAFAGSRHGRKVFAQVA